MADLMINLTKTLQAPWAKNPKALQLWLHLLFLADHDERVEGGCAVKRGEVMTSREDLAAATLLSDWQVRTLISLFSRTGHIQTVLLKGGRRQKITITRYAQLTTATPSSAAASTPTPQTANRHDSYDTTDPAKLFEQRNRPYEAVYHDP